MRKSNLLPGILSTGFRVLSVRADVLIRVGLTKQLVEQMLCPHNAVHRFTEGEELTKTLEIELLGTLECYGLCSLGRFSDVALVGTRSIPSCLS